MTTKKIEAAINETNTFGYSFLGNQCFDVIADTKKIERYISKHNIENTYLSREDNGDWFLVRVK